jgi:mRNA-degrading endonuclease YafQ of YafQ-DinJ toxin-antitoxin module
MKLAIRIQHKAKSREHWLKTMLLILNDKRVKVVTDADHSLYGSWKKTIQSHTKKDTHILILQDDILPCADFIQAVEHIIKLLPNEPITFFSNIDKVEEAVKSGISWVKLKTWFMAQAYVLPIALAEDMYSWIEENIKPDVYMDDNRMATYMFYNRRYVYATAPSLVEHMGWNSSTLNGYVPGYQYERNLRMAKAFIGIGSSALNIDWSKPDQFIIDDTGNNSMFCSNLKDPGKFYRF